MIVRGLICKTKEYFWPAVSWTQNTESLFKEAKGKEAKGDTCEEGIGVSFSWPLCCYICRGMYWQWYRAQRREKPWLFL